MALRTRLAGIREVLGSISPDLNYLEIERLPNSYTGKSNELFLRLDLRIITFSLAALSIGKSLLRMASGQLSIVQIYLVG